MKGGKGNKGGKHRGDAMAGKRRKSKKRKKK
jgi:hypothetical protein